MSAIVDTESVYERFLDAPRELVFRAFSDPAILAQWWGPKGFTNTFQEFDFRPGGAWRFVMHGPDGADYPITREFVEIVPPQRISHLNLVPTHRFLMTVTLAEEGSGTRLHWSMRFDSAEEFARVRDFIAEANVQNIDRLEAQLKTLV